MIVGQVSYHSNVVSYVADEHVAITSVNFRHFKISRLDQTNSPLPSQLSQSAQEK